MHERFGEIISINDADVYEVYERKQWQNPGENLDQCINKIIMNKKILK